MNVTDLPRNMQSKIQVEGQHWIWTGAKNSTGYGCVGVYGKSQLVHRVVWELLVGPIPEGLVIDHVVARGCGLHACCNPACLEPVTGLENIRRGIWATKTHCPRGHEYAGENLRLNVRANGQVYRNCRECLNSRRRGIKRAPSVLAPDDPRHGTTACYTYHGCRCESCRRHNTERLRIWRERKSA